jgi:nucleotide-binding universal stress UspA family protein
MLPEIKKILYTTNLGNGTRPVFRYALSLARSHNAKLFLLHVVEPLSMSGSFLIEAYMSKAMADQAEGMAKKLREETSEHVLDKIKGRVERIFKEELGATPEELGLIGGIRVLSGSPAEMIVQEARDQDMDLIVVGSQAHSSLTSALLGSTARKVTLMSDKPVLLVPMRETDGWGD